MINFKLK